MKRLWLNVKAWHNLRQQSPAWLVSLAFHVLLLVALALIAWQEESDEAIREVVIELGPSNRITDEPDAVDLEGDADAAAGAFGSSPDASAHLQTNQHDDILSLLRETTETTAALQTPTLEREMNEPGPRHFDPALAMMLESGGDRDGGNAAAPGAGLLDGRSDAFQRMVTGLRARGLDVVFVIDATGNMGPYVRQVQQRLGEIVGLVTTLITPPDADQPVRRDLVRFGIVAFKDYGDEYGLAATRHLPLTADADALRHFIDQVQVDGGGDATEPIDRALAVATSAREMGWQRRRKSIIILLTEASIHPTGRRAAFNHARQFHREYDARIDVIDLGGAADDDVDRQHVLDDLQDIARHGGGEAFRLENDQAFWRHLIVAVFGRQHAADVDALVERYARDEAW